MTDTALSIMARLGYDSISPAFRQIATTLF
jgi:hypothetical protein